MVKEELKYYTYKELSGLLQTPDNVVRKKVKKHQLKTDKKLINGRKTEVVFLSEEQIQALQHEIEYNKSLYSKKSPDNDQSFTSYQPAEKPPESKQSGQQDLIPFMKDVFDRLESTYKALNEKDKQLYLLETLESNKNAEIRRLLAENKALNEQIILLKKQLEQERKKPFWKRNVF